MYSSKRTFVLIRLIRENSYLVRDSILRRGVITCERKKCSFDLFSRYAHLELVNSYVFILEVILSSKKKAQQRRRVLTNSYRSQFPFEPDADVVMEKGSLAIREKSTRSNWVLFEKGFNVTLMAIDSCLRECRGYSHHIGMQLRR